MNLNFKLLPILLHRIHLQINLLCQGQQQHIPATLQVLDADMHSNLGGHYNYLVPT